MGEEPDQLREQVARTRADMDRTLDAIASKADVSGRAREALRSATGEPGATLSSGWRALQTRPALLAGAALASGLLLGRLLRRRG